MKIVIPTTSYWHKLSNEEKKSILNCGHVQKYYKEYLNSDDPESLEERFIEILEKYVGTIKFAHDVERRKLKEQKAKELLRQQMFADFGVSDEN